MGKKRTINLKRLKRRNDRGTTLVEMIACFALLGFFMACAAVLISNITSTYYTTKGEVYSREVADIVLEKIVSEVDGAEFPTDPSLYPSIAADHLSIDLCDKTDTHIIIRRNDNNNKLEIYYYEIGNPGDENHRNESNWYFDDSVYNGFAVKGLRFYRGGDSIDSSLAAKYGLAGIDLSEYNDDVVLVLMEMHSEKYGDYYFYRFIKMYNSPGSGGTGSGGSGN